MGKVQQLRLMSLMTALPAAYLISCIWIDWQSGSLGSFLSLVKVIILSGCMLTCYICWNISRRRPNEFKSMGELFAIWSVYTLIGLVKYALSFVGKHQSNIAKDQENLLTQCLRVNADTVYSKDHHLSDVTTVAEFIARHPLTKYDHYRPYVDRCVNGEANILCKYPVDYFAWTSGTSGKNKVYPYNWHQCRIGTHSYATLIIKMLQDHNYSMKNTPIRPMAMLVPIPKMRKNDRGMDDGTIGAKLFESFPSSLVIPPSLTWNIRSEKDFLYVAAIFAMQEQPVLIIHGFAPSGFTFYKLLEKEWPSLCNDIANGRINRKLDIQNGVRAELESKLRPNPKRAYELKEEFEKGMEGITRRIWPEVDIVLCAFTGSFSTYREIMSYYLGDVLTYGWLHISTEGVFGVNMWPLEPETKFMLCLGAFYEFIPEQELTENDPSTVLAHQVEVGKCYEIVITNIHGFCRYRVGDVIKIVGFEGQVPVYHFQYRLGQMLNAFWEKTPESAFTDAMMKATSEWGEHFVINEYTATESINMDGVKGQRNTMDKFYVVFVEIASKSSTSTIRMTEEQKEQLDLCLRDCHELYDVLRGNGSLKQMLVHQVKLTTFQRLKDRILSDNNKASAGQFKMPRAQRNKKYLTFLMDNLL